MAGESQRIINVISTMIGQSTGSGLQVAYTPGVVASTYGSGYMASVYVRVEDYLEDLDVPEGMVVSAGDYVMVAETQGGEGWIGYLLPSGYYSKSAFDYVRRRIVSGDGDSEPESLGIGFGEQGGVTGPLAIINYLNFR